MATKLSLALAFVAAGVVAQSALPRESDPIRLIVDPAPGGDHCELHYFLIGSFGGYGGFVTPARNGEYAIPTVHDHVAVDRLKAYLQCTKYQVETIVFDALPPPGNREIHRTLKPLGTVPFFGRIRGLTQQRNTSTVTAYFTQSWYCGFFQLNDCGFGGLEVATAAVDADGNFHVELPDFATDPTIAHYGPGDFDFRIIELQTMNRLFDLKAVDQPWGRLAIRAAYPPEQLFDAFPAR